MTPRHPAKFTAAILDAIRPILQGECVGRKLPIQVLDPFAGVGGVHALAGGCVRTFGIELEPEWAAADTRTFVGSALDLPWDDARFDAIVTSPAYGNRMADHHEAKDDSRRNTYRHSLGRPLSEGSSGGLQWGDKYRQFHLLAWCEADRVLRPGGLFIVNIKDHIRKDELQHVPEWHYAALGAFGLRPVRQIEVAVRGNQFGANGNVRIFHEWVLVFRKPAAA